MPKPYGPLHIKAVFTFTISMRIHQRIKKNLKWSIYMGTIQYLTSYQKIYQVPGMLRLYVAY